MEKGSQEASEDDGRGSSQVPEADGQAKGGCKEISGRRLTALVADPTTGMTEFIMIVVVLATIVVLLDRQRGR